jgi:hypothetical protein
MVELLGSFFVASDGDRAFVGDWRVGGGLGGELVVWFASSDALTNFRHEKPI